MNVRDTARQAKRLARIVQSRIQGGLPCGVCGFRGRPRPGRVLWPTLIDAWQLSPEWVHWIDQREGGRCAWCRASLRSGQLAQAIVEVANSYAGSQARTLDTLFEDPRARSLRIAEINSAGDLHPYLKACPGLRYSEFAGVDRSVPRESLLALSYADASLDMVVTSDTLEHVPDIHVALREIHRVLRPGACHVFSTPMLPDRPTRQRARLSEGRIEHLLPPSHHGGPSTGDDDFLVFYEFGIDFPSFCRQAGFEVSQIADPDNPALVSFIARRPS